MTNGEWATLLEKRCANMQKQIEDLREAADFALKAWDLYVDKQCHKTFVKNEMKALRAALAKPYTGGKKE